jgi:hypothetical protein
MGNAREYSRSNWPQMLIDAGGLTGKNGPDLEAADQ